MCKHTEDDTTRTRADSENSDELPVHDGYSDHEDHEPEEGNGLTNGHKDPVDISIPVPAKSWHFSNVVN